MFRLAKFADLVITGLSCAVLAMAGLSGYFAVRTMLQRSVRSGAYAGRIDWSAADAGASTRASRCDLVRFTDAYCRFCKLDKPELASIAAAAKLRQCALWLLAPEIAALPQPSKTTPGFVPLLFVPLGFARSTRLRATPTTFLIGEDGRILWSHQGVLYPGDVRSAIESLHNERN